MSGTDPWATVTDAREEWHTVDTEINRARMVHARLTSLRDAAERGTDTQADVDAVTTAFERWGKDRAAELSYLTEPVFAGSGKDCLHHFQDDFDDSEINAGGFVSDLANYVDGSSGWNAVETAFDAHVTTGAEGWTATELDALSQLITLFGLVVEAAIEYRDLQSQRIQRELASVYDSIDDPLTDIDQHPIALLPVHLETRFVADELLIRIYNDQIHVDSHEPELTEDEVVWGQNFWATVWFARHPDPKSVDLDPDPGSGTYLPNRLPNQRLRDLVADIDLDGFSDDHDARYSELKERAWRQLVDRFDRERAAYVVHRLAPTGPADESTLLTQPSADDSVPTQVPELAFPTVERRPEAWTKQSRARLLPDQWIVIAEWEDDNGDQHRTIDRSGPVREPLAVGPSAESVARTSSKSAGGSTFPGMEWMTDFAEAERAGMGLRIPLTGLEERGFDATERGFTRVVVLGVKASMDAETTPEAVTDLLDAHHYTDGLAFLEQGTPTNNHDMQSGYTATDPPDESMTIECGPPLVEDTDRSDGDLLSRALALGQTDGDHVFGHVENADRTEQLDAYHMNSALWPATIGYYLKHILVDNRWTDHQSIWDQSNENVLQSGNVTAELAGPLSTLDAYRNHFIRYVRGRGPLPAIRVGRQPYGVLPAAAIETDLELFSSSDTGASGVVPGQSIGDLHADMTIGEVLRRIDFGDRADDIDSVVEDLTVGDALRRVDGIERDMQIEDAVRRIHEEGSDLRVDEPAGTDIETDTSTDTDAGDLDTGIDPDEDGEDTDIQPDGGTSSGGSHPIDTLESYLGKFKTAWTEAATDLPFRDTQTDDTLIKTLKREAVSSQILSRVLRADTQETVSSHITSRTISDFQHLLRTYNLTDLDPRAAYQWQWDTNEPADPRRIDTDDLVDSNIDAFIDVLLASDLNESLMLSTPLQAELVTATSNLDIEDSWGSLDANERRRIIYEGIIAHGRPFDDHVLQCYEAVLPAQKLDHIVDNWETHGDTGALRSLLRMLLHYGHLHEYLSARLRVGQIVDDPPTVGPESATHRSDDQGTFQELWKSVPDVVSNDRGDVDTGDDYATALYNAAAHYDTGTSLDPRLSEFTDSVRYLATKDPETLTTLTRETLDLANHRLDAWWTSFATRRLFGLRATQGRFDPLWGRTHDRWDPTDGWSYHEFDPGTTPMEYVSSRDDDSGQGSRDDQEEHAADGGAAVPNNPGLYVGAYGFVENLRKDSGGDADPTYIHAPSEQHATTAAILNSGYQAYTSHDGGSEMADLLAVDLSPDRVRDARRLIDGVRQGQSLGELVGYRLERRFHEVTMDPSEPNLNQYKDVLRKAYPTVLGKQAHANEQFPGSDSGRDKRETLRDLGTSDVVDGYQLVRNWDESPPTGYPFGYDSELPDRNTNSFAALDDVIEEVRDGLDAVRDLLMAESVHQLGQGNFERAGVSLDTLAKGETPPELEVIQTPRTETGVTHRQLVLFEAANTTPTKTLQMRPEAEPALDDWVETLLPSPSNVECVAEYRWEDAGSNEHRATTVVTLADLNLSSLDVLHLVQVEETAELSELEQRLRYHVIRTRSSVDTVGRPPIPIDADIELSLTDAGDADVSMAELLELARSIRELVQQTRPATAEDLQHPTDESADGTMATTVSVLEDRANVAQDRLLDLGGTLDERLSVLDPNHEYGAALGDIDDTDSIPVPASGVDSFEASLTGQRYAGTRPMAQGDQPSGGLPSTILEQVDDVTQQVNEFATDVPLDAFDTVASNLDGLTGNDLIAELETLVANLPVGPTDPAVVPEDFLVRTAADQDVSGPIDGSGAPSFLVDDDPVVPAPDEYPSDMTLSVEAPGDFPFRGTGEYVLEVRNGDETVWNDPVTVIDDLPDGIEFVTAEGPGWQCSNDDGIVTCEHPNDDGLQPGERLPALALTVELVSSDLVDRGQVENCAAFGRPPATVGSPDRTCTTHDVAYGLELDVEASDPFHGGQLGEYVIRVHNWTGETWDESFVVLDSLPEEVDFVSESGTDWRCEQTNGEIHCEHENADGLSPGESLPALTLTVEVDPSISDGTYQHFQVTNTVRFEDAGGIGSWPNAFDYPMETHHTHAIEYGRTVEVDAPCEFRCGETSEYVIRVCNWTVEEWDDLVVLYDTLPDGIAFVESRVESDGISEWVHVVNGQTVVLEHEDGPPPGERFPALELVVEIDPGTEFTDDVVENCVTLGTEPSEATPDQTTCINHPIDYGLSIEIEPTGSFYYEGSGEYVIRVCNESDVSWDDPVVLHDVLPGGMTFTSGPGPGSGSGSGSGWSCSASGGTIVCEHPNATGLDPSDCLPDLTFTVDIPSEGGLAGGAGVENRVGIGAPPQNVTAANRASVTHLVEHPLDIEIETAGGFPYQGTGEYVLRVCNRGDADWTDPVVVYDVLPDGFSFDQPGTSGTGWSCSSSDGTVTCEHQNGDGLTPGECLPDLTLSVDVDPASPAGYRAENWAAIAELPRDALPADKDCVTHSIDVPVDVIVWSTSGTDWFDARTTVTASSDDRFTASFDFGGLDPGTPFEVAAIVEGTVVFSTTGRVFPPPGAGDPDPASVLDSQCPILSWLLWLDAYHAPLMVGDSADTSAARLHEALSGTDWGAIQREESTITSLPEASTTITTAEEDAIADLVALKDVDLPTLADELTAVIEVVTRLGLDGLFDVTGGDDAPPDAAYWFNESPDIGNYRSRIAHTTDNPYLYLDDAADPLLKYNHESAAILTTLNDPATVAAYLDAFLDHPPWTIHYLDATITDPHALLQELAAWLYHPGEFSSRTDTATFADRLDDLAAVVPSLSELETVFDELDDGGAASHRDAFASHLTDLADAIENTTPSVPTAASERTTFENTHDDAVADLSPTLHTERTDRIEPAAVATPPMNEAFRHGVLETVRLPLMEASYYGIFGSVPGSPDGGRPADEVPLVEQTYAVLADIRERLQEATALDPRPPHNHSSPTAVTQQIEEQTDRIQTLFGESFVVLPPFTPVNGSELKRTFNDTSLLSMGGPLAPETWLQRVARVRDRPATFRETLSYAEVVGGTLTRDLDVGQLPYRANDDWAGLEGVDPDPGRLSLVAQCGSGIDWNTPIAGLFIDEWVETVPSTEETTGVALNYDDPGMRAPQSVLLAVPPDDGEWSLNALASVVYETMDYMKLRAVDLADLDELEVTPDLFLFPIVVGSPFWDISDFIPFLPALYLAENEGIPPKTPSINLDMLDWYPDPEDVEGSYMTWDDSGGTLGGPRGHL